MHIIFIDPPFKSEYGKFSRESRSPAITKSGALYYPLWLIYAAAYAESKGHDVSFIDAPAKPLNDQQTLDEIQKCMKNTFTLFVYDTSTPSIKNDIRFVEKVKFICPDSFHVLVGTHPTACVEETFTYSSVIDAIAVGEYDRIILRLAEILEGKNNLSQVPGLAYRNEKGEIVQNEAMPLIEDLDEIPFASAFIKKHLNEKDYFFAAAEYPEIQIFTGRGCPCRCNFCVYPQIMHGHKYRARSPENVVEEFQYIQDHFPDVKEVVIEDDTFTIDKERVKKICSGLIERGIHKKLHWLCNARVNTLDFNTMKLMRRAGCNLIIPGLESGNQQILDNIKKGTQVAQFLPYVKNAKKAGLRVHACWMFGNQGENSQSMQDTLRLALKLNTDTAQFFPLIPYPGTEAYRWARENNYIEEDYEKYCKEDGTHNTVLNLPGLSAEEMVSFCNIARRKYYLRLRYILHRLWVGLTDWNDFKRSVKAFAKFRNYLLKK